MRSFDGQFSDNRPLKRTREEKVRQLAELKETWHSMKPHSSPELRTSIAAKIKELMAELIPLLKKMAQGREISGLKTYE